MLHFKGYKESVIEDSPFAFWTFDYDRYDSNGQPIDSIVIKDEIHNVHTAQIVNATDPARGLSLGYPSLVPNQQGYGKALGFCPDGFIGAPHNYAKSFLWIDHNEDFNFTNKTGFTVEFIYNKQNENDFEDRFVGNSIYPYIRPIFIKKDFLEIIFYCNDSQGMTQIQCKLPNGQIIGTRTQLFDVNVHFAVTFEIQTVSTAQYREIGKILLNGQTVASYDKVVQDFHATLSYPSPIYIGGTPTSPPDISYTLRPDRHGSLFLIDQIAVYSYPLTKLQIAGHFKKMHEYSEMIKIMNPPFYWQCDNDSSSVSTLYNCMGAYLNLPLMGDNIRTDITDETILIQKPFIEFKHNSGAIIPSGLNYLFEQSDYNNGFSLGGWYKLNQIYDNRTTIISCLDVIYPFKGIKLEYIHDLKVLRLSSDGRHLTDYIDYPNYEIGLWYHLMVTWDHEILRLYINGEEVGQIILHFYFIPRSYTLPNHLFIGGTNGGDFNLTQWVMFRRALESQEAAILYGYNITHIIKGITTVENVPRGLLLRFYDTTTGRLVVQTKSNPQTGEYFIKLPSDLPLYLVVTDENDPQSKSRVYSNIIPSEQYDYPIELSAL